MNKKIQKLFNQALNHALPHTHTTFTFGEVVKINEQFAELIVRECLNNMENCDGDLDFAIWKTKQDFGVEQE